MSKQNASLIVLDNNYQVTNKEMKKELSNIVKALNGVETNTWSYAFSVYKVINDNLFVDDFGSVKEFAKYIGSDLVTLSKYTNAVKFVVNLDMLDENGNPTIAVSKAYLLSTIKDYEKFVKWCTKKGYIITDLSKHELENVIKEYNNKSSKAKEETQADNEERIEVVIDDVTYSIPVSVLNKYIVAHA